MIQRKPPAVSITLARNAPPAIVLARSAADTRRRDSNVASPQTAAPPAGARSISMAVLAAARWLAWLACQSGPVWARSSQTKKAGGASAATVKAPSTHAPAQEAVSRGLRRASRRDSKAGEVTVISSMWSSLAGIWRSHLSTATQPDGRRILSSPARSGTPAFRQAGRELRYRESRVPPWCERRRLRGVLDARSRVSAKSAHAAGGMRGAWPAIRGYCSAALPYAIEERQASSLAAPLRSVPLGK
jgi:hypothetical protein